MINIRRITSAAAAVALVLPMAAIAAASSFESMDKNHDGSISRAEYDAAHKASAAGSSSSLPSRSIEERSKGMVHSQEQGNAARSSSSGAPSAGATTQRPSRDIEERSKGITGQK